MTNEEFEAVQALTLVESMEGEARILTPDEVCIRTVDYNALMTTLRTWRSALRNSIEIRKKRADAGSART